MRSLLAAFKCWHQNGKYTARKIIRKMCHYFSPNQELGIKWVPEKITQYT